MEIAEATARYEAWLGRFMPLVRADIREKHRRMRLGPFPFLRATFYRWCQLWSTSAGELGRARRVLAVGDLHLENFGTWRDVEGRLIWGLNDFDEATPLPWTQDLVRLAASAYLAADGDLLGLPRRAAAEAILEGYRSGIQAGGPAFVLEEEHGWLRQMAMTELREPVSFWQKLDALPPARAVAREASAAIEAAMPAAGLQLRWARRVAGMGSLGRQRVVGLADWQGGRVAREAKALAPSAWLWATDHADDRTIRCDEIVRGAIRVPDPTVRAVGPWLIRRLAPHCSRIELADLPTRRDEARLLHAMGFETANVHGGTRNAARTIRKELDRLEGRWLHDAAKRFAAEVIRDWRSWRRASRTRRS